MTVSPDSNVVDLRRGPGRPKGAPNKASGKVKELAQRHGKKAIRALYLLMTKSESETVRLKAAESLLDRAYGRPVTTTQLTGGDGGPIQSQAMVLDISARIADVFGTVAKTKAPTAALGDDEMKAVMAINFINASRDTAIASRPAGGQTTEVHVTSTSPSLGLGSQDAQDTDASHNPATVEPEAIEPGHEVNLAGFTIRCRTNSRAGLPPLLEVLDTSGGFLRNAPSLPEGLAWLRKKFSGLALEEIEVRKTPRPSMQYRHPGP